MSESTRAFQSFALIPAAGRSRRMGQSKLLLPWHDRTLMEHVIERWRSSSIDRIIVIAHRDDCELIQRLQRLPVELVVPETPPHEMKDSIACGLRFIEAQHQPQPHDVWLVAPADLPELAPVAIDALLAAHTVSPQVVRLPSSHGRDLHPAMFPWPLAREVFELQLDETLRTLVHRSPIVRVEVSLPAGELDVDTPADYLRLTGHLPPTQASEGQAGDR